MEGNQFKHNELIKFRPNPPQRFDIEAFDRDLGKFLQKQNLEEKEDQRFSGQETQESTPNFSHFATYQ